VSNRKIDLGTCVLLFTYLPARRMHWYREGVVIEVVEPQTHPRTFKWADVAQGMRYVVQTKARKFICDASDLEVVCL
jgi:hypothetical protein